MVRPARRGSTKRRGGRSKRKANGSTIAPTPAANGVQSKVPRSFILHSGSISTSVTQLLHDLRSTFEPYTAASLKQTKSNKLKDFVNISGILGVSHMLVLNQPGMHRKNKAASAPASADAKGKGKQQVAEQEEEVSAANDSGRVNVRICTLPRGPTLTFRINKYSLRKDVLRAQKRPPTKGNEYLTPPLLVLNNFGSNAAAEGSGTSTRGKEVQLMISLFQNLFPPIHVQTMHLSSARRIVLLHYNPITKTIDWRHYVIQVRPVGVSKRLRRMVEGSKSGKGASSSANGSVDGTKRGGGALPDLSQVNDISDYVLGSKRRIEGEDGDDGDSQSVGGVSGFETDATDTDAESDAEGDAPGGRNTVDLFEDYVGKGNLAGRKRSRVEGGNQRAVRLREIGPRLEMRLIKIEEGIGGGDVLYHDYVKKSASEQAAQRKSRAEAEALKAQRRAEQERNVERKKAEAEARKTKSGKRGARTDGEDDDEEHGSNAEAEEDEDEEEDDDEFEYEDRFADEVQHDETAFDDDEELFEDVASDEEEEEDEEEEGESSEVEDESENDLSPVEITSDFEEVSSAGEDEEDVPVKHTRGGKGKAGKKARRG